MDEGEQVNDGLFLFVSEADLAGVDVAEEEAKGVGFGFGEVDGIAVGFFHAAEEEGAEVVGSGGEDYFVDAEFGALDDEGDVCVVGVVEELAWGWRREKWGG